MALNAGALSAVFFYFATMLHENGKKYNIDIFMETLHNGFSEEYHKKGCISDGWKNIMLDLFPDDIHMYCNEKLCITINLIERYKIVNREISFFDSKIHLIDVVHTSMFLPFLSENKMFTEYYDPSKKETYCGFDGIVMPKFEDQDKMYPTMIVDFLKHNYPIFNRPFLLEKSYEFLAIQCIRDTHLLFSNKNNSDIVYFYSEKKTKNKTWINNPYLIIIGINALMLIVSVSIKKH